MTNIRQRNLGFIQLGVGFVLMAVGVYELAQPDEFKSVVRVKLELPDYFNIPEEGAEHTDRHADFIQRQVKDISSDAILSNVVYRLELRDKWDKKFVNEDIQPAQRGWMYFDQGKIKTAEIIGVLRSRLEVIRVPKTPLIDIVFVSDDAVESALVANTLAEAYLDWRFEKGRRLAQQGITALKEQLEIEDGKIKAAQDELDRLRKELKVADTELESGSSQTNFRQYWDTKRTLERLNDLRDMITRKINVEEMDLKLPQNPQVVIIERAVPSKKPVRRHRPLGAALSLTGMAILGCGLALVWKSRPPRRHDSPA